MWGFIKYVIIISLLVFLLYYLFQLFFKNKTINEKLSYILRNKDLFKSFYNFSIFSSFLVFLVLIVHFCCYFIEQQNIKHYLYFNEIIYISIIGIIAGYILFVYPYVRKTKDYFNVVNIYNNELFLYKMYYEGYYRYRPQKIPLLFITVSVDNIFSLKELNLFHDFLIKLRSIYSDLKSVLWFPEIFYVIFLLYFIGDNYLKPFVIFSIIILLGVFLLRLYILYLLFLYFKDFIYKIIYPEQTEFMDILVDRKLRKILMEIDQNGVKLPKLKALKEYLPILGSE